MDKLTRHLRGRSPSSHELDAIEDPPTVARTHVNPVIATSDLTRRGDAAAAAAVTPIQQRNAEQDIPMLPVLTQRKDSGQRNSAVYFGQNSASNLLASNESKDSQAQAETEPKVGSANSQRTNSHDANKNDVFSRSTTSTGVSLHKKTDDLAVSHLPAMPNAELQRRAFWKALQGLVVVLGGWALLVVAVYLFKALAVKYNLAVSDRVAEWIKRHPTATTQLFTVIGVMLAEVCFQLWESAIVYFAVRRLAYGKERTEVLTYVAWSKLKRGAYTFSRRRTHWPGVTLVIWLATNFFAPGWTTLLTPSPMTQVSELVWTELDFFSPTYTSLISADSIDINIPFSPIDTGSIDELCSPSYYIASLVATSKEGAILKLDYCPQYSNVEALMAAGITKLQASHGSKNAILKLGNASFIGGTGGVAPLGPQGVVPGSEATVVPGGIKRPKDYDYKYGVEQQGMSVEIKCTRSDPGTAQPLISSQWIDGLPGYANVSYFCPGSAGTNYSSSIGIYTGQSVATSVCHALKATTITGDAEDPSNPIYDSDYTVISLLDFLYQPLQSSSQWLSQASNRTGSYTNLTSIGGDAHCSVRPYFASFVAEFDSNMNYFQAQEEPDTREYITGKAGELYRVGATNNTLANIQKAQARFLTALPGLIAMGEVFQASNVVSHLTFDPSNPPAGNRAATITPGNTLLVGENTAGNLLSEYLLGRNGNANISMPDLEIFMQGVFEYTSSQMRLVRTYNLTNDDDNISTPGLTRNASGYWNATTLGYGQRGGDNSPIVYISLLPMVIFALLSWGLVAWSHYYDRPRGTAYIADCDPTDLTDCIIAASPGGLQGAFHRDALHKKDGGLKGARSVRIRLGHIYRKGHPNEEPQLGFVDVD